MCASILLGAAGGNRVAAKQVEPPVRLGADGRLAYVTDPRGDRVLDFSHAGYRGGGVRWPDVAARVRVAPVEGDDGPRIQAALDHVASLPADAAGMRGAVLLEAGRYEISDRLRLRASGVVLRGAGPEPGGTLLVATGRQRRALIEIGVRAEPRRRMEGIPVSDAYVPVGALKLRLAEIPDLKPGATILIERPSPLNWIASLGMDDAPGRQPFNWKPGTLNLRMERRVAAVDGAVLTLDAPLPVALDRQFGGGTVHLADSAEVRDVGVEHVRCESTFEPGHPTDEEHAWTAVHVAAARDVWVAGVTGAHFAGSLVFVSADAARVTVQDCGSLAPVSEDGGFRRMTFHTAGQQTLFLRCRAENGRHDFTTGHLAAGPNVFLDCAAENPRRFSGAAGSWACGALFDNVRIPGAELRLDNLEIWNQGVGWSAANSVLWQSAASVIICRSPPGAPNWAIGPWGQFIGDGRWVAVNEFARPDSLYVAQLSDRLGAGAGRALEPRRAAPPPGPVASLEDAVPDLAARLAPRAPGAGRALSLANGWLVAGGQVLTGEQLNPGWWRGSTLPALAPEIGPALTRFVPDRIGTGLTDDLAAVAETMVARRQVAVRHHWGLWYDRRRDDHQMIPRADGDVWAPFFEYPWERTGQGRASNGLSRYDLTRFNPWYFGRLREFAAHARERGLVLIDEMYFQHNILEAGAHWAEFPWRSANNVNETGFPEPPHYLETDGSAPSRPEYGKRIFVAEAFYDIGHPQRRELHRAYIRQCLANLADQPNVIHLLGEEYSGPLHFMQFWIDVVAEWERETGRRPLIGLSAPKDVQDAILDDPARRAIVDVIDLKYWWRTERELFAPRGGQNLAPRQHERLWKGGRPSAASIAGMVREYRSRFPEKAVITALREADGWAFVTAGGSLAQLPAKTDGRLLAALARMKPMPESTGDHRPATPTLAEPGVQYLIYAPAGGAVTVDLRGAAGAFVVHRLEPASGSVVGTESVSGGAVTTIETPARQPALIWIASSAMAK